MKQLKQDKLTLFVIFCVVLYDVMYCMVFYNNIIVE